MRGEGWEASLRGVNELPYSYSILRDKEEFITEAVSKEKRK